MQPSGTKLDIVSVMTVVAGWALSPEAAAIVGPYTVIFLAALFGAVYAVANKPRASKSNTCLEITWRLLLAVSSTVVVAEITAAMFGINAALIFVPVAVLLAVRPDWVIKTIREKWDSRTGRSKAEDPEPPQ